MNMKKIFFENKLCNRSVRIKDFCSDGTKILILYPHGLGDVLMFYPFFEHFKKKYPKCVIDIKVNDIIKSSFPPVMDENYYDYVFWIPAYFNEKNFSINDVTKPECNVLFDLGIEYDKELEYSYKISGKNNLVGFSFFNSFHPREINCPYDLAKYLWEYTQESGFLCIDLFIPKKYTADRVENKKYDFVDWSMQTKGLGINKMISLMHSIAGMASVATGNFHYGMTVYPQKMLYIEKDFSYKKFTNKEVLCLNVYKPDYGVIKEWIKRLQS